MATTVPTQIHTTLKSNWPVVAGLILLSIVPALGGMVRLGQMGGPITPENARFMTAPIPVLLHIFGALTYSFLGAFQFSDSFRRNHPKWHRTAGTVLIPAGLVVALSGIWMTLFYTMMKVPTPSIPASYGGPSLAVIRVVVGAAMTGFIVLGCTSIAKRDIPSHRAWMIRAYALAMGAGTQVFTHIPWAVFPSIRGELALTLCMAAGWVINAVVAEWVIMRTIRRTA